MSTFGVVDSRNWSVFGQVEYDLTEQWTVVAGLAGRRTTRTSTCVASTRTCPRATARRTFNIDDVAIPGIDTIDYGDYAARLQLNFKPVDGTLLYASFNRGIKGGNWSLDPLGGVPDENLKHGEEVLNAYELGLKTDCGTAPRGSTWRRSTTITMTTSRSRSWVSPRR